MEFDVGGDMTSWVGIAYTAIIAIGGWIYRWGNGLRKANEELAARMAAEREVTQEKFQKLELKLAASYHDKDSIDDLFDLKLKPVLDILVDIKDWMRARDSNGFGSGNGRHS